MNLKRYNQLHEQLVKAGMAGEAAKLTRQFEAFHSSMNEAFAAQTIVRTTVAPVLPLHYYDATDNRSKMESLSRMYYSRTTTEK